MPSPKWKLVVDIGDHSTPDEAPSNAGSSGTATVDDKREVADLSLLSEWSSVPVEGPTNNWKDSRIKDVVELLGEFTPSDTSSTLSPYLPGFMSLRLLLLRQSRTDEEEEFVKTMLDSFSSYTAGGRRRSDIALMLARDCMFLSHQQQNQQPNDGAAPGSAANFFGLPPTNSFSNSPALAPIPIPGSVDSMSIVSD